MSLILSIPSAYSPPFCGFLIKLKSVRCGFAVSEEKYIVGASQLSPGVVKGPAGPLNSNPQDRLCRVRGRISMQAQRSGAGREILTLRIRRPGARRATGESEEGWYWRGNGSPANCEAYG